MVKVLKGSIVLLFLLSIGSLVLGIMLFQQREKLKSRILDHEKTMVAISEQLRMETPLKVNQLKDHLTLPTQISKLPKVADNMYKSLQDTIEDLERKKNELTETIASLEATRTQLAAKQEEVNDLEDEKVVLNERLDTKDREIDGLQREKNTLAGQIEDFRNQLANKENEIEDLNDRIRSLEKDIQELETKEGIYNAPKIPEGEGGTIVLVNDSWNFVVLDIGMNKGLGIGTPLQVHRDKKLIGNIKVTSLEDAMAVADILEDFGTAPIQSGDEVIYVDL